MPYDQGSNHSNRIKWEMATIQFKLINISAALNGKSKLNVPFKCKLADSFKIKNSIRQFDMWFLNSLRHCECDLILRCGISGEQHKYITSLHMHTCMYVAMGAPHMANVIQTLQNSSLLQRQIVHLLRSLVSS